MVRKERLEPSRLSAPAPKAGASTNSATFAAGFRETGQYSAKRGCSFATLDAGAPVRSSGIRRTCAPCRSLTTKTFPSRRGSRRPRCGPPIVAIYHFARAADDIADEGDAAAGERLAQLDHYGAMLDRIAAGRRPHERPVRAPERRDARARAAAGSRFATCSPRSARTCSRHATPISRSCSTTARAPPIRSDACCCTCIASTTGERQRQADAICTGLQLANFWQDVAIDWDKGRIYLPKDDMSRFGVAEAQIADGRSDDRWRALIAFEVQRTRACWSRAGRWREALPLRLKLELSMVVAGGLRILRAIDAVEGDVFRHQAGALAPRLGAHVRRRVISLTST